VLHTVWAIHAANTVRPDLPARAPSGRWLCLPKAEPPDAHPSPFPQVD
jgi:hypothetical protein